MKCPSCFVENQEQAQTCFACGQSLLAVLRRGSLIASRYEILNPLGKGGMGMVYKAHDRVLEEDIAIKVLRADVAQSPEVGRRFRSEIRLARKVSHRNVCRIHEYGEDQGVRYISMELIEGVDLKQIIRERKGGLPPLEAFDVSIQMAKGLQAIHEVGVVHRDLKAANIMRDRRGVVKLMDFGIAKEDNAAATSATAAGDVVGTPEYMSPEQARGQKVDARSDIYALAVVIHEVFSGDVPFRGDTPIVTIFKQIQDQPLLEGEGAPPFPTALVRLLKRGLAKEPSQRFATADELVEALRDGRRQAFPDAPSQPPVIAPPAAPAPRAATRGAARPAIAPVPIASPPTLAPATPTPLPAASVGRSIRPPKPEKELLPPTLPVITPKPAPAAPDGPPPKPAAAPVSPAADVRGARQQTQPLPPSAVVPSPPPGTGAETPAQRLLVPGLVVVSFLLVMLLGVLVVGRLIRTAGEAPPSAAATAAPPPTAAPTPGPVVTVEETITVPLATPAPTLVSPSMEPATASPSPPPTPRPAAPRPTPKPTPRPAEASPEQLRAQQAASLVGQAETAWALQKYDEAGRRYDEALQLEAGNARAAAGKARSQWAAAATRKVFALGRTVSTPAKSGKGPAGFEAEDVALKNQDFVCEVGIEIDPPAVKPGDDYGYVASVSLVSAGKKSIKIKSLQANVTLDGAPSSESPPALVREVQKQRAAIAEIRGAWKEGMKSWRLEVIVTADKGDSCRNSVNWR